MSPRRHPHRALARRSARALAVVAGVHTAGLAALAACGGGSSTNAGLDASLSDSGAVEEQHLADAVAESATDATIPAEGAVDGSGADADATIADARVDGGHDAHAEADAGRRRPHCPADGGLRDAGVNWLDAGLCRSGLLEDGGEYLVGQCDGGACRWPGYFSPVAPAIADFNGDCALDVVTTDYSYGAVSVLLGNGDGTLQRPAIYPVRGLVLPEDIAVGDFDRSGSNDIATADGHGNGDASISVWLGAGDGGLNPPREYAGGNQTAQGLSVADVNGDEALDILLLQGGGPPSPQPSVALFRGNGDGTFQPPVELTVGASPNVMATVDVNHDGKIDLVVSDSYANLNVLLGNGDSTFQPIITSSAPCFQGGALALGDFDEDGQLDVAEGCYHSYAMLHGNGDGTFGYLYTQSLPGPAVGGITAADVDLDGHLDLSFSNAYQNVALVYPGYGNGYFGPPARQGTGRTPLGIAVGDLNDDGWPDLAVACANADAVSVLLNRRCHLLPADAGGD